MKTNKFLWALTLVLVAGLYTSPLRSEEAPDEAPPPIDSVAEEGPGEPPPSADAGDPTAAPSEPQVQYNPDGAEEAPAPQPETRKKVRAQTPPPAKVHPKVVHEEESQPAVAEQHQAAEASDEHRTAREEAITDRVKALVKRFDARDRKGNEFPSLVVETAIRAEFMRRTEGNVGPAWMKKRTREADKEVALDNLEMLLTYAEKLGWATKKGQTAKDAAKDLLDTKMLAVKAVVDKYNYRRGMDDNHTTFSPAKGLSPVGKVELGRRRNLGAGLIAGEDYAPITTKKYDDFAKKYREALTKSVSEYEKLARLMGGGTGNSAAAAPAVAAAKEKKVDRKPASKAAPEKATKKKKRRRSSDEE